MRLVTLDKTEGRSDGSTESREEHVVLGGVGAAEVQILVQVQMEGTFTELKRVQKVERGSVLRVSEARNWRKHRQRQQGEEVDRMGL